ncbi:hypothetical protein [Streptomyces sp. NPDC050738]|uniref:hypothetical protein n=1 Tax=Streptomyces sp. NPDC050738 TaxID=3154744 RepID=UPI00343BFD1E
MPGETAPTRDFLRIPDLGTPGDAVAERAHGAGGVAGPVTDFLYGRRGELFEVIARPATG